MVFGAVSSHRSVCPSWMRPYPFGFVHPLRCFAITSLTSTANRLRRKRRSTKRRPLERHHRGILHRRFTRSPRWRTRDAKRRDRLCYTTSCHRRRGHRIPEDDGGDEHKVGATTATTGDGIGEGNGMMGRRKTSIQLEMDSGPFASIVRRFRRLGICRSFSTLSSTRL